MRRQYLGEDFVDANLKERESMPHEGESLTKADPQQQSGLHSSAHICLVGVGCAGMEAQGAGIHTRAMAYRDRSTGDTVLMPKLRNKWVKIKSFISVHKQAEPKKHSCNTMPK